MPTPTIQAKLVLSTDNNVTATSSVGKQSVDLEAKKTNKILGKMGNTIDFALGREGSKAFRTINSFLPLMGKGIGGLGEAFGAAVVGALPEIIAASTAAAAGVIMGNAIVKNEGGGQTALRDAGYSQELIAKNIEFAWDETFSTTVKSTEELGEAIVENTMLYRDQNGQLQMAITEQEREMLRRMNATDKVIEAENRLISNIDATRISLEKLGPAVTEAMNVFNQKVAGRTAQQTVVRSFSSGRDLQNKQYAQLGFSKKEQDADQKAWNDAASKAKIKIIK